MVGYRGIDCTIEMLERRLASYEIITDVCSPILEAAGSGVTNLCGVLAKSPWLKRRESKAAMAPTS